MNLSKVFLSLDLNHILDEAQGESDLVPYFVKLILKERGIPVKINLKELRHQPFEVESGRLDWEINDNLMMEICYEH